MEFSRPEYWSGQPFPSPGDLPDPGIKPRSPALQADSLPAEPQGKPKNTGVGSLSLLQRIFLTQESNQGLLHRRWILYQLSDQGAQDSNPTFLTPEHMPFSPAVSVLKNPPSNAGDTVRPLVLEYSTCQGFPHSSVGKESACNAGDLGSVPGLGRSPGEGKGYPLQYSGLENSMNCIVHAVTKSWTGLSDFHFTEMGEAAPVYHVC